MHAQLDFEISGQGTLAVAVRRQGFTRFGELAEHVRQLPYGRLANAENPLAPLMAARGTCSSKHRLLAALAHECGHCEVQLMVGLYAMSEHNTPGVGAVLAPAGLEAIPEAHCYLQFGPQRYDYTGLAAGCSSAFAALLFERVVDPQQLSQQKIALHQDTLRAWAKTKALTFAQAWALREACIATLAANAHGAAHESSEP